MLVLSYLFSLFVFVGCVAFLYLNFIVSGFALEGTRSQGPFILHVFNWVMLVVPLYPILVLCAGYLGNLDSGSVAGRLLGAKASLIVAMSFGILSAALFVILHPSYDFSFSLLMVVVLIGLVWSALKFKERERN